MSAAGLAEIVIYNARGAVVKTLVTGELPAGPHVAVWDGTNDHGRSVASGLYLARLKSLSGSGVQRMMLVR